MPGQKNSRKPQPRGPITIDSSAPLRSVRHEKFAQAVANGKVAAEAYKIAGFKGDPYKRATDFRGNPGICARIAAIQAETNRKSQLTKEEAIRLCAELALGKHKAEPHHRIAAMEKIGKWCGWEKGTEAEQAAAKALGGVADMMSRIRAGK